MKSLKKFFKLFRSDPRLLQLVILVGYSIVVKEVFNHERPHYVLLITFLVALLTELCFSHFKFHKLNSILPAATISQSICFLTYTPEYMFYYLAAFLAIFSKGVIHYKGRHVFNPSNFGITVTILLFPNWISGLFNAFSGIYFIGAYFLVTGGLNCWNSKTYDICLTFLGTYVVASLVRGLFFDNSLYFWNYVYLILNPSFLIYCFHMINDPATTPRNKKNRLYYGASLGLMYVVASYLGVTHASFFILFLISSIMPFIRDRESLAFVVKPTVQI
jgi:Na+-transporting NADH:ubiquinone oxidoreductase subunit NqrB